MPGRERQLKHVNSLSPLPSAGDFCRKNKTPFIMQDTYIAGLAKIFCSASFQLHIIYMYGNWLLVYIRGYPVVEWVVSRVNACWLLQVISDKTKEKICRDGGREGGRRDKGEGKRKVWLLLTIIVLCFIVVHEPSVQGSLTQRDTMAAVTTIREPTNHSLGRKKKRKKNH